MGFEWKDGRFSPRLIYAYLFGTHKLSNGRTPFDRFYYGLDDTQIFCVLLYIYVTFTFKYSKIYNIKSKGKRIAFCVWNKTTMHSLQIGKVCFKTLIT